MRNREVSFASKSRYSQPGSQVLRVRKAEVDGFKTRGQGNLMSEKSFYLYRYLMGAMPQNQLTTTVRLMCTDDDQQRLPEIIQAWRGASAKMVQLTAKELGAPDTISVESIPETVRARCAEIESDSLFQASFSDMPTTFEVVAIDKLVARQRDVNLDYVATLQERIPEGASRT